jgi:putative transposase
MPAHIIQRGVNSQICFAADEDMAAYANWLYEGSLKFGVSIHVWVFMTNHVHLLLKPQQENAISNCMQYLGRYYVRYFNYRYKRTGTLFEDRFKSHPIQTTGYSMACSRYIELNPVRAGMIGDPAEYMWSS